RAARHGRAPLGMTLRPPPTIPYQASISPTIGAFLRTCVAGRATIPVATRPPRDSPLRRRGMRVGGWRISALRFGSLCVIGPMRRFVLIGGSPLGNAGALGETGAALHGCAERRRGV